MRPISRLSHFASHRGRAAGLALVVGLFSASLASAQTPAAPAPTGPALPLSAYVPGDKVLFYVESAGLDANVDAWKKSSTYKILNDTPTGSMLDDVLSQYLAQTMIKTSKLKITGTEAVTLAKHLIRNGFVVAAFGSTEGGETPGVIVLRGVLKTKEMKPIIARFISSGLDTKVRPKAVDVDGHKIVVQKSAEGKFSGYWVDDSRKEDLIYIPSSNSEAAVVASAKAVFDTLEGKIPNATNHPKRVALAKEEDGFTPVALAFMDLGAAVAAAPPGGNPATAMLAPMGLDKLKNLDLRIGFQGAELVTIGRLDAPKPRTGLLALLDQPTFEKSSLPPIPEGVTGFSVVAFDPKGLYDKVTSLATTINPQAGAQIDAMAAQVKAKTRLRLKEDILSHFGPKMAIYVAPSKASSDAKPAFSPLSMLTGGLDIPRLTIVVDIDDPVAFGRMLDELMIQVNQGLRTAMPAPPVEGEEPRAKGAKGGPGSGVEFKLVTGPTKVYMLSFPSAMAGLVPSYIKPTIRVGPKHVVISISPDSARAALEVKGGGVATTTYAAALQPAPAGLVFAQVEDNSDVLSKALATFPGALQAKLNAANAPPPAMAAGGPPGAPGAPGAASYPGGSFPGAPGSGGGADSTRGLQAASPSGAGSSSSSSSSSSSAPMVPGQPGPGGQPGGAPGASGEAENKGIVFNIDASKLPSAAAIKPFLAPSLSTISIDDQGVKFISRSSFPDISSLSTTGFLDTIMKQAGVRSSATGIQPGTMVPPGAGPGFTPAGPAGAGAPGVPPGQPGRGGRGGRGMPDGGRPGTGKGAGQSPEPG